jgi:hypothetical protein
MFIFFFRHLLSIIMGSSHVFFLVISMGSLFNIIAIESSHNLAYKQIYMKHGHVPIHPPPTLIVVMEHLKKVKQLALPILFLSKLNNQNSRRIEEY